MAALFGASPAATHVTTFPDYAEVYALLLRKKNRAELPPAAFRHAGSALRNEVLASSLFHLLTVDNSSILAGIEHIQRHNLNSSDAAILAVFLRYAHAAAFRQDQLALVASDHRLLRAARNEGLAVIDPEQTSHVEAHAALQSL